MLEPTGDILELSNAMLGDFFMEHGWTLVFRIVDIKDETIYGVEVGRYTYEDGIYLFLEMKHTHRFFGMGNVYGPTLYKMAYIKKES